MPDGNPFGQPSPPAAPPPQGDILPVQWWKDFGERQKDAAGRIEQDMQPRSPLQTVQDAAGGPFSPHALKTGGDVFDYAMSPLQGAFDTMIGRPVEQLSGGRIKKKTAGDVASFVVPFGGEVAAERAMANAARKIGVTVEQFKTMLKAREAAWAANKGELARRTATQERIGAKPSLTVGTTSPALRTIASHLGGTALAGYGPGAAVKRTGEAIEKTGAETAAKIGQVGTDKSIGDTIRAGIKRFSQSNPDGAPVRENLDPGTTAALESAARSTKSNIIGFGNKANVLMERADRLVGNPTSLIKADNTAAALNDHMALFDNPSLSQMHRNPILERYQGILAKSQGKLSWQDARQLRTRIRMMMTTPELRIGIDEAELKRIYGALSEDLQGGAYALGKKAGGDAYREANKFYYAGQKRIENTLNDVFNTQSSEKIFADLYANASSGVAGKGNLEKLTQVKRSLTPSEWRDFSASVLSQMGVTTPGKRGEQVFSPETFFTNFENMSQRVGGREDSAVDSGLKLLFEGEGKEGTFSAIQDMAENSGFLRELRKLYNHSQSGYTAADMGMLGGMMAVGAEGGVGHDLFLKIPAIAMTLAGNFALENASFVKWLAKVSSGTGPKTTDAIMDSLGQLAKTNAAVTPIYHAVGAAIHPHGQDVSLPADHKEPDAPDDGNPFGKGEPDAPDDGNPFGKGEPDAPDDGNPFGKGEPDAPTEETDTSPATPEGGDLTPAAYTPDAQVGDYLSYHLGGPVVITGGPRTEDRNDEVGGAKNSAHLKGEAWDFKVPGQDNEETGQKLARSGIQFDQIEITPTHVHVSFDPRMRGEIIHVGRYGERRNVTPGSPRDDLPDISHMSDDELMALGDAGEPTDGQ